MSEIVNKVAKSRLITLDLKDLYTEGKRAQIDIRPWLFMDAVLKEREFRAHVDALDISVYKDAFVSLYCSADAIVPTWAYMLLAAKLQGTAKKVFFGSPNSRESILFREAIARLNPSDYNDGKVVIKGCSDVFVPEDAYVALIELLLPVAKSIMYGEPCSTVPLFKRK
ncbi:MAG: DUF2480 family protein [Flavobacteriales bacterium]